MAHEGAGPDLPDGFSEFWAGTVAEAEGMPLDFDLFGQSDYSPAGHDVRRLEFKGIAGEKLNGWVALPKGVEGKSPGFLWLPPYSRWSMLPNEYGAREGYASVSLNYFGEPSFHEEVYKPARGYFAEGAGSPESWVFRRMLQDAVIVGRIFAGLPEVDAGRIGASGMSQGGGMAIWLGAVWPVVRAVVADMPFLGAMQAVLGEQRAFRYPLKELTDFMEVSDENRAAVLRTVSFFDTVNMASGCEVPTRVTLGLKDPAVKPFQAREVYDALPGVKETEELDWGHDWHPRMIEGGQTWFGEYL